MTDYLEPFGGDYAKYRESKVEKGKAYEDFVYRQLHQRLYLTTVPHQSRAYQYGSGENAAGIEIKLDNNFKPILFTKGQ